VAPSRGRGGRAELTVGLVVVGKKGESNRSRHHTGSQWIVAEASPDYKSCEKDAVGPQHYCECKAQRRSLPLSSHTLQHSPVRQPAEQRLQLPRRYVLHRRAQEHQRQRRPEAPYLNANELLGQRQQCPRCVPGQDTVHDVD